MFRKLLNGVAVAGLATALLASTAVFQTASADFASDLSAATSAGTTSAFADLGKTYPAQGAAIGKAIGGIVDEGQAASFAGQVVGEVKNAQFSATLFQGLGEYYPAARAEIAAAVIAADPTAEAAVAAALEELNTAAGAGLLSNPGPGAAPVNVNSEVSPYQEAFVKSNSVPRLGNNGDGPPIFGPGGPTTSPTEFNEGYTPPLTDGEGGGESQT